MFKVSINITTYNHSKFIGKCLESVLVQKTNFPFEIILGEDESTDGTREICKEYAKMYPGKIRLFLRCRKDVKYLDGKAIGRFNFIENLKECKGQYIALLEGDDYWTDPYKLQKQVDLMESNPSLSICFHKAFLLKGDGIEEDGLNRDTKALSGLKDLIKGNFIRTCTVLYRKEALEPLPASFYKSPVGDYFLHILASLKGDIGFINEFMAVYRIHDQGIWENKPMHYRKLNFALTRILLLDLLPEEVASMNRLIIVRDLCWYYNKWKNKETVYPVNENLKLMIDLISEQDKRSRKERKIGRMVLYPIRKVKKLFAGI